MVIPEMNYQYELTHFKGDMGHGVASDVFVCIVQELEECRSFECIQTSDCWIILVRMIFARELSIVSLNFSFGCSESKPKNRE